MSTARICPNPTAPHRRVPRIERGGVVTQLPVPSYARGVYDIS